MGKSLEWNVLYSYLYDNLSTRELCKKYSKLEDSTGFKSHEILKKYGLDLSNKGMFFFYSEIKSARIVDKIIKEGNAKCILSKLDSLGNRLEEYKDTYILAKSDLRVYNILNGNLRNIVQSIFVSRKKGRGCQYKNCHSKSEIHAAHSHKKNRKNLFLEISKKCKKPVGGGFYKYPVYDLIRDFILWHRKEGAVYLLCHKHHTQYDSIEDKGKFLKNLNFY